MLERTIVLPLCDNQGQSNQDYIKRVCGEILAIAGGYSAVQQQGVWLGEDGTIYEDASLRILTAVDGDKDTLIENRLPVWCALLKQECLYTHTSTIEPRFVEPETVLSPAFTSI